MGGNGVRRISCMCVDVTARDGLGLDFAGWLEGGKKEKERGGHVVGSYRECADAIIFWHSCG